MSAPTQIGKSPVILDTVGQRIPFRVKLGSIKLSTSGSSVGEKCRLIDGVTGQNIFESICAASHHTDELHLPTHTAIYEAIEVAEVPSGTVVIAVYYE